MSKNNTKGTAMYERESTHDGTRRIVVLDKGFVFVGNLSEMGEQGVYTLTDCHNIRRWQRNGIGGLSRGAKFADATLDKSADIQFHRSAMIFTVRISEGWEHE
jgi:hypothetical protein